MNRICLLILSFSFFVSCNNSQNQNNNFKLIDNISFGEHVFYKNTYLTNYQNVDTLFVVRNKNKPARDYFTFNYFIIRKPFNLFMLDEKTGSIYQSVSRFQFEIIPLEVPKHIINEEKYLSKFKVLKWNNPNSWDNHQNNLEKFKDSLFDVLKTSTVPNFNKPSEWKLIIEGVK